MISLILASGLSILFTTITIDRFCARAFSKTNLVCGIGPSAASTSSKTPSTIFKTRSTSPPKSAWPGVSTILTFTPLYLKEAFLAKIVMPLSLSISPESITLSLTTWLSLKVPLCLSIPSTKVVLPWSTWAIMAMFLISSLIIFPPSFIHT